MKAADLFSIWSPSQPTIATTFLLLQWLRWQSNQTSSSYSYSYSQTTTSSSYFKSIMFSKPITSTTATSTATNTGSSLIGSSIYNSAQNGSVYLGRYRIEKTIGKGSYGKVKLAYDQQEERYVALKFIARSSIKKSAHWTRIKREMNLLRVLDHPNVIRLYEVHETAQDFVLAMEYVRGQDLFDHIVGKGKLEEGEARTIFTQLLSGLEYLHGKRVVHRDLKPENVMVDAGLNVKLIDFGFATLFDPKSELATNCGSPLYAAPEIVKGVKYVGPEVDAWSVGVVLYGMITGCLPFEDDNLKGLYGKICAGEYTIPEHVSQEASALIRGLICVDPRKRLTMKQALRHKWLMNPMRTNSNCAQSVVLRYETVDEGLVMQLQRDFGLSEARRQVMDEPGSPGRAIYDLLYAKKYHPTTTVRTSTKSVSDACDDDASWTVVMIQDQTRPVECELEYEYDALASTPRRHVEHAENAVDVDETVNSSNNFVLQAAASVMNKFRRLREYAK